jgi:hypothetical protein
MGPYEDLFNAIPGTTGPGDDFEARVLGKIRRKKRQRRQMTVMGFGLAAMLGIGLWVFSPSGDSAGSSDRSLLAQVEMEEVPLLEEVTFSTSDRRTEYPVELVSLTATEGGM